MTNHFLKETDFSRETASSIFAFAAEVKAQRDQGHRQTLVGQSWGMIFSKSSTRTRVSFEVALRELGANPIFLNRNDIQLGRGESVADTAKVLSRYLHGLIVRTYDHQDVEVLASEGGKPVINALTDFLHPCQLYTDVFTLAERWARPGQDLREAVRGRKVAFLGDCACNLANSWILGADFFEMELALSGPASFAPGEEIVNLMNSESAGPRYTFTQDPYEAVRDADMIYTDVWVSMGKEQESADRIKDMRPFAVTKNLLDAAKPDVLFMHCLPAYVGMEVTQEVLDDPRTIIWDQAENRLHVQKAILNELAGRG
ncbi:MAG: ornithine carbamoyltransferase [Opitutales bacterium]|nr:ornithine carbamoyltransferase [Opitutales bacterium]MCH8539590.1 ornithine carbamoyltransferase [Opitutales bacterium]